MNRAAAFELLRQFSEFLNEEEGHPAVSRERINQFLDDTAADE